MFRNLKLTFICLCVCLLSHFVIIDASASDLLEKPKRIELPLLGVSREVKMESSTGYQVHFELGLNNYE